MEEYFKIGQKAWRLFYGDLIEGVIIEIGNDSYFSC